jgi:hypothetical protein
MVGQTCFRRLRSETKSHGRLESLHIAIRMLSARKVVRASMLQDAGELSQLHSNLVPEKGSGEEAGLSIAR